jgi:hypothetical protein
MLTYLLINSCLFWGSAWYFTQILALVKFFKVVNQVIANKLQHRMYNEWIWQQKYRTNIHKYENMKLIFTPNSNFALLSVCCYFSSRVALLERRVEQRPDFASPATLIRGLAQNRFAIFIFSLLASRYTHCAHRGCWAREQARPFVDLLLST